MENTTVVQPKKIEVKPSLFGIGEELGKVLNDAVTKATNLALENAIQPIQVVVPEKNEVKELSGYSHEKTPTILRILSARLPLFLVGEAGSGKTHLVEQCAEALGLPFYCISVCAQTTASTLLGYMDANGKYVRSLFRDAYENGGVFLLDEVDNGNPNVLSVLNASISNHVCSFPDQMVKKHKDFILCASGNTYGHGANRKYVGRLEIDGATLDRFVFVEIGYDEKLEDNICGNKAYAKIIQALRKRAQELKLRNIISPRASINGVKLLKSGISLKDALKFTVFRDMSEDTIKQLTEENKDYEKAKKDYENGSGGTSGDENEKGKKRSKKSKKELYTGNLGDESLDDKTKELLKNAKEIYDAYTEDGTKPEMKAQGEIDEVKF